MFDPYRKWLGIPEGQRPPTHYQLLGISADEQDREVINAAVVRHSAFIRTFQVGQYSNEATQLLNEIAAAKVCLLDPRKRAKYDAGLAERDLHSNARTQDAPVNERRQPSPVPVPPSPQRKVRPAAPRRMPAPAVRAAVAPDPLLSIPADIWSTADDQPRPLKIRVNRKPGSRWFPWAWFLAAGAGVLVLVVFVGGMRTRREV
ncbi:MAG TPA: hypothetical protein VFI31_04090, partial [Pirellulales bacterium]|nr:hypothetical protein [Pirellulales bacterium]